MASRTVVLELTLEQEDTIKALFAHNDWDFKEIRQMKGKKRRLQNTGHPALEQHVSNEHIPRQNNECEFCFQAPCITLRDLPFVGGGQVPCDYNSAIRKEKYGKYWKVMANIGGWNDPRYLAVKQERANGGEWAIQHRREVMPKCVLQQLRNLYPNPKDKSYMDHKWE